MNLFPYEPTLPTKGSAREENLLSARKIRAVTTPKMSGVLVSVDLSEDRFNETIEHLKWNFFADEPLNRGVGLCDKGNSQYELERHCMQTMKQGFSRMLVDEYDGTIAGVAINGIMKKGEQAEAKRRLAELNDEKFKIIFGLLYKLNDKVDLFEKYNVEDLFECRILSVDEKFRGKGLANILMGDSIEVASNSGFKVFKADATGMYSQRVCLKHGFHVEAEIPYSEIDASIRPSPPHEALKLMVKILDVYH